MLQSLRAFLNRPLAEDFSFRNQAQLSAQAGLYVFLFVYLFGFGRGSAYSPLLVSGMIAAGCVVSSLMANVLIPRLGPAFYDEDRWTVGKHSLHALMVLLCVTAGNQLVLYALGLPRPSFPDMYLIVTLIGFFPIAVGVFVAEQRRLKRNLAHAQMLNEELAHRPEPMVIAPLPPRQTPPMVPDASAEHLLLFSENGRERLSLQPGQLLYVESVGNYVEVHWLNRTAPQKTVLRSTLKEIETALTSYPQFLRCHRAFVVNLAAVSHTEGNARGYQLTLTGSDAPVPVSRSYLAAFDVRLAAVR